ncbi:MAG: RluA family pseudouridine synthase [Planctomycetota bacterium]|nr:RluA family pseudouridine synthase [Planctomycetota bacterium]
MKPIRISSSDVIHDDPDYCAIAKPAGISTVSERWDPSAACLIDLVWDLWKKSDPDSPRPHVVHRLDKETTGVILFAKNSAAQTHLRNQFMARDVQKCYGALVVGLPDPPRGECTFHVEENPSRPGSMRFDASGKECSSRFQLVEAFRDHSWMMVYPRTGRTHQVRLTMVKLGTPICCDSLYGSSDPLLLSSFKRNYRPGRDGVERPLLKRLGLHALSIQFRHPATDEEMTLEAELPRDLAASLRQLRRWRAL